MSMDARIRARLDQALDPVHIELANESHMHNVPPGSESHWNLLVVSAVFEGKRLLARQRVVYGALQAEMADGIHALTMRTLTQSEWQAQAEGLHTSPPCLGGGKTG